jgi:hypothetical protein
MMKRTSYRKLALALGINSVVMYLATFAMIERGGHLLPNLSRVYMTLVMVAPMGIVMLIVMRSMFEDRRLNLALHAIFAGILVGSLLLLRNQVGIGDREFLRAMIPHHSEAILMCEEANLRDPEIRDLCVEIVEAQRREIDQMERMLGRR